MHELIQNERMWDRLLKFEATDGKIYWTSILDKALPIVGDEVSGYSDISRLTSNSNVQRRKIGRILAPVPNPVLPIVCIGINYAEHAREANIPIPQDPVMWYKPPTALADPGADIQVASTMFRNWLDYEGELVIITSRDAKNVTPEEAKDYILGYTIGNDLTARACQDPKRGGGQFSFAKAHDQFGPVGPVLCNARSFDYAKQTIQTRVNGEVRQSSTFDFIHTPEELVSFLSTGTTLPAGTAIFTGTPSGVGYFQKPPKSLKAGDVVEVEVTAIGMLRNRITKQSKL